MAGHRRQRLHGEMQWKVEQLQLRMTMTMMTMKRCEPVLHRPNELTRQMKSKQLPRAEQLALLPLQPNPQDHHR